MAEGMYEKIMGEDAYDMPDFDNATSDSEGTVDVDEATGKTQGENDDDEEIADKADGTDKAAGDEPPKHPEIGKDHPVLKEFEEKIAAAEKRAAQLEARMQILGQQPRKEPEQPKPTFKNMAAMSVEELQAWQDQDPKGYAANLLQQAKWEIAEDLRKEAAQKNGARALDDAFRGYSEKHSDFMDMVHNGSILKYVQQNPGHNAFSAHLAMKLDKMESDYQAREKAAVEKAVKEAETKWQATIKNKKAAAGLKDQPSNTPGDNKESVLKNPKKYGFHDDTMALLHRHKQRMKAS